MANSFDQHRDRPPLEWETAGEFKNEEFFVRVNRAKGRRIFSMEIGGTKRDGSTTRFVPMSWEVAEGDVITAAPRYPEKLTDLIIQARNRVVDILSKEGVRFQPREHNGEREPMRKGKSERDRNRRRERRD